MIFRHVLHAKPFLVRRFSSARADRCGPRLRGLFEPRPESDECSARCRAKNRTAFWLVNKIQWNSKGAPSRHPARPNFPERRELNGGHEQNVRAQPLERGN